MKLFPDACSIFICSNRNKIRGGTRLLINQALQAKTQLVISRLSFLECRVLPLKAKNPELLNCYDRFFRLPALEVVELDATVIDIATELRANHPGSLRTPDAIQLACAITSGADQFLTGDKKLAAIQEIKVTVV
ncbi:type II toxin-antitoxin system VapC family toxin [Methylomonas rivi]|uniref:Type II toxin-antitoxin system VapC family toxin n=1 Tax=Methylomonas rivi TaxID=2952226 RepID=A0ABT1U4V2_9GAMM|nr:type II toxin-antitoxin system VapC family toxin [Methylomonas sp. WSC-6]MCQ8128435.1 type II toxin-antitoxin system VapC family toxin [Methylomonas sp. WSC-6]